MSKTYRYLIQLEFQTIDPVPLAIFEDLKTAVAVQLETLEDDHRIPYVSARCSSETTAPTPIQAMESALESLRFAATVIQAPKNSVMRENIKRLEDAIAAAKGDPKA